MYTATEIAGILGVKPLTIGKIAASMVTKTNCKQRINVGLQLKSTTRGIANPLFVYRSDGRWFYTEKAKSIIEAYCKLFPNVVKGIEWSDGPSFQYRGTVKELQACYKFVRGFKSSWHRYRQQVAPMETQYLAKNGE